MSSPGHPLMNITESSAAKVAVPAGDNHPLAPGPVTATTKGSGTQVRSPPRNEQQQQQQINSAPASSRSPTRPVPQQNFASNTPPRSSASDTTTSSPSRKSFDVLADDFLSAKAPPVQLRPSPLPRGETGIVRLRTLVERRAWGDVLKLASTLLNNNGSSSSSKTKPASSKSKKQQYSRVYASLLFRSSDQNEDGEAAEKDNANDVPDKTRRETVEIMMLQCNAWLKLRRYADLSKEVQQWKFLKQNDVNAPSIEWLPWGIRK